MGNYMLTSIGRKGGPPATYSPSHFRENSQVHHGTELPSHDEVHVAFIDAQDSDKNVFLQMQTGKLGMFIHRKASMDAGQEEADVSFEVPTGCK